MLEEVQKCMTLTKAWVCCKPMENWINSYKSAKTSIRLRMPRRSREGGEEGSN